MTKDEGAGSLARGRASVPRGGPEVRRALIVAAAELFARRGPGAVTVREVAAAAGVNHGLVHHYFGGKDLLVGAVLDHLAEQAAEEVATRVDPSVIYADGGPTAMHGRIVAHLLVGGADPAPLRRSFPAMDALRARFRDGGLPPDEASERSAQVVAMIMGWQFFEPFLTEANGLELSAESRRRILDDAVRRLVLDVGTGAPAAAGGASAGTVRP
ncbi:MAG TPA: helix-turn-helix domain-containing protein [Aquihabitans sp.]|jgi:AcrR family transcriptional regulator|nr:helix-turn-helix domain-containing protein [Aquihabitans sp.]